MNKNNFEEQLDNLKTPPDLELRHQTLLKITLLKARKSSQIGIAFVLIPCLFLFGIFLKYWLGINLKIFTTLEDGMANLDKSSYLKWIVPLMLVGLPLISIIINSLAIMHFYWDKVRKEMLITIKYKLLNLILMIMGIGIVAVFILYAIVENAHQIGSGR